MRAKKCVHACTAQRHCGVSWDPRSPVITPLLLPLLLLVWHGLMRLGRARPAAPVAAAGRKPGRSGGWAGRRRAEATGSGGLPRRPVAAAAPRHARHPRPQATPVVPSTNQSRSALPGLGVQQQQCKPPTACTYCRPEQGLPRRGRSSTRLRSWRRMRRAAGRLPTPRR